MCTGQRCSSLSKQCGQHASKPAPRMCSTALCRHPGRRWRSRQPGTGGGPQTRAARRSGSRSSLRTRRVAHHVAWRTRTAAGVVRLRAPGARPTASAGRRARLSARGRQGQVRHPRRRGQGPHHAPARHAPAPACERLSRARRAVHAPGARCTRQREHGMQRRKGAAATAQHHTEFCPRGPAVRARHTLQDSSSI